MIRKSTINLTQSNTGKTKTIVNFIQEYSRLVNLYIDRLWYLKIFYGSFLSKDLYKTETWLSVRAQQAAGKQAFQIVKSQRKLKDKDQVKPVFKKQSIELDSRFIEIQKGNNSFDLWVKFTSMSTKKIKLYLPSRKHYHFNQLDKTWTRFKSTRLRQNDKGLFLDIFFKKSEPFKNKIGKVVGLDSGIKKLAVLSDGQVIGKDLELKIDKILRKVHGSKSQKRAIIERNEYINSEIKKIDYSKIKTLVVENLNGLHYKTKGRISKKFSSKLHKWCYARVLQKLGYHFESTGVQLVKEDPSYTSQRCPRCGYIHRSNRNGELFKCKKCGFADDADLVASLNISDRFDHRRIWSLLQKAKSIPNEIYEYKFL